MKKYKTKRQLKKDNKTLELLVKMLLKKTTKIDSGKWYEPDFPIDNQ